MYSRPSRERVICSVCFEQIVHKNLKTHFLRHHPGDSVKFTSSSSKNISNFFHGSTEKKIKLSEDEPTSTNSPSTSSKPTSQSDERQIEGLPVDSMPTSCGTSLSRPTSQSNE